MSGTALGSINESDDEIVKLRMQSTPEQIDGFHRLLKRCEELGMCEVMNFSQIYSNKGTNKYFRAYSDLKINEKEN